LKKRGQRIIEHHLSPDLFGIWVYQTVLEKYLKNQQKNAIVFFKVSMKPFSICPGVYS